VAGFGGARGACGALRSDAAARGLGKSLHDISSVAEARGWYALPSTVKLNTQITHWAGGLFELSSSELGAATAFIEGYEQLIVTRPHPGLGPLSEDDRLLLLQDISVFVWLDDSFASATHRRPVPWSSLFPGEPGSSREAKVFDRLHAAVVDRGGPPKAIDLWLRTGIAFLELQERDWAQRSRGEQRQWTFLDYVAEAEVDSTIQHMLATLSLIHGLDMHERMEELVFRSYLRNIGVLARLLNDLSSVERERTEEAPRNVVLFLEGQVDGAGARSIIETRVRAHRDHLARDRASLGPHDVLAHAGAVMLEAVERVYTLPGVRYEPS
jgi:Terpene synthase family 2, C-terminal metal binding